MNSDEKRRFDLMREALHEIVTEADQSNGGKGADLPFVVRLRDIAADALREAMRL